MNANAPSATRNLSSTWTVDAIQRANEQAGLYFFSPNTLKFFKSRILSDVFEGPGGIYFVTSERAPGQRRLYNVRRFFPETGRVESVENHGWLTCASVAQRRARKLAGVRP